MVQTQNRIRISCGALIFIFLLGSFLSQAATLRDLYEAAVDAYNKGQYDKAIGIYQGIIKESPQFAPAYIGLGLALKDKGGDLEEVVYYYKTAVEKDPTNSQALEQLGRLYYSIGQLNKAQAIFEKVLRINPTITDVKLSLAWINLIGKRINPERAIFYFKEALKSSPTPNAYFGLGMAYFADNQRVKALDIITQLKSMGQEDLAGKLEKAMRENRRIILDEFNTVSQDEGNNKNNGSSIPVANPNNNFASTGNGPKGYKVRLSGKLDDL